METLSCPAADAPAGSASTPNTHATHPPDGGGGGGGGASFTHRMASFKKGAPKKRLRYAILDSPPIFQAILLGFQVRRSCWHPHASKTHTAQGRPPPPLIP
jgi:hypothetical protein